MERIPPFPLPALGALALAVALSCCQRADSDAASSPTDRDGSNPANIEATKNKDAIREEAKRYYASLLERHGEDYAACGPSERTLPKECDAARDIPGATPARSKVLLMLDASGSMAARIGGETKMAVAQDALIGFTRKLSESADVALRVYGHTGNNQASGKAESCAGSELLYPFEQLDAARFEAAIRSFRPTGWTPIAASLDAAAQDFASAPAKDGPNVVYVVSDGIETCDADPVQAARTLHESDIDVVVNVIGFDVDAQATRQLEAVAKAGGGEYLAANSRNDLLRIFNQRFVEAHRRYNCMSAQQHKAYNETSGAQYRRYNCLSGKAYREYNGVSSQAYREYNRISTREYKLYSDLSGKLYKDASIDPDRRRRLLEQASARLNSTMHLAGEKRDYAIDQAQAKRDTIIAPAHEVRDRTVDAARDLRDRTLDQERELRDQRLEQAREERDSGKDKR